ncbi:MAG TPA: hypothetical protein ENG70_05995 [Candidatus Cloacimonetes bacterium]|nr:hypothetical protein [Candidatus Cloacimonadota bacterium]HEX38383.1 hypothetical protein [Candidatus Cloacimonadota bacterium]
MNSKRILWIALVISIIIHFLILVIFPYISTIRLDFFPARAEEERENRLVFEIVETPDVPDDAQDVETDVVSDKSLIAADEIESVLPEGELPFNDGESKIKDFQEIVEVKILSKQQIREKDISTNQQDDEQEALAAEKANSSHDPLSSQKESILPQLQEQNIKPTYDNMISEVEKYGGISFNTYNWNFAPYMLYLKKKIQNNLHPPPGFTYLGLIQGKVLVRFEILRNGNLNDLEVLHSNAHASLVGVSTGSIEISAPFQPLPPDFPEDSLIVTSLFSYIVEKK